jgi:ABC-2 type transport system permease protein
MTDLFVLISPRLMGLKNLLISPADGTRKRAMIMAGLGFAFCGCMFFLSCRVLTYFQSVEVIGEFLSRLLLSMTLLTFFSLLIFSHIIAGLSNMFLSRDLDLCHSMPAMPEEIFLCRAFFTFIDSSWMLIVFGLPIFMAYGYVYRPGAGFYLTLIHMSLAMAIIAAGIGIFVTMILVFVFPAQRTKDVIMLLSVLMIVALYVMFRFLRPERLVNPDAFFTVTQYLTAIKAPKSPYLPSQWIAETLWDCLTGSGKSHLFETALTWSTAAATVVINVWVAHFVYFEGFSKSQEGKKRNAAGGWMLDAMVKFLTGPFNHDLAAVMAKDVRTFFRDNTQWSQLLLLVALVIVYIYNFSVLPLEKSPMRIDFLQNEMAFLNMGLAGFVLSAVSARFVFTAVSSEGEAYWILRSSPMEIKRYLWGKFAFFLFPMSVLGEILIIVTNIFLDVTPFMMWLSSVTMFFMVFGIVAMGIGLGALYPNFRYENIAQVSTGFGGVMYMMISSLFIASVIVLEAWPVYVLFTADIAGQSVLMYQWFFIVLSFIIALVLVLFAVFIPIKKGLKALQDHEG